MPPFPGIHKQLVYANTRHADAFSAVPRASLWTIHGYERPGNYPVLHVLTVNHSAFSTANSRQLASSSTHSSSSRFSVRPRAPLEERTEMGKRINNYNETKTQTRKLAFPKDEDETKRSVPLHGNGTLTFFGPTVHVHVNQPTGDKGMHVHVYTCTCTYVTVFFIGHISTIIIIVASIRHMYTPVVTAVKFGRTTFP